MDIIDKIYESLEMISDDLKGYYNIKTGQILWISEYYDNDADDTEELECHWENYTKTRKSVIFCEIACN